MNREEALALLEDAGCPDNVIDHCIAVSEKAVILAEKVQKEVPVDRQLVEIGGLLHDIGRAVTHGIDHGVVGARLLKERGINGELQKICERHVCAGIPKSVAREIGLPPRDFIPVTMEEKIIAYADNLTGHTIDELRQGWGDFFGEHGKSIVSLLDELHKELAPYL